MATDCLLIPIHLDALYLKEPARVLSPTVDFSLLPYQDSAGKQQNHQIPFLGDYVSRKAFSSRTTSLAKGVHLHWALPDALAQNMPENIVSKMPFLSIFGHKTGSDIWQALMQAKWLEAYAPYPHCARVLQDVVSPSAPQPLTGALASYQVYLPTIRRLLQQQAMPPAPNRWMISRVIGGKTDKQWVLESDYLWPVEATKDNEGLALNGNYAQYPIHPTQAGKQAFRYMGRKLTLDEWNKAKQTPGKHANEEYLGSYAGPLTALGYGDPTFAALYPNCQHVFGMHDTLPEGATEVNYQLQGWYDTPGLDYLQNHFNDFFAGAPKGDDGQVTYPYLQLLIELRRAFQWIVPLSLWSYWELDKKNVSFRHHEGLFDLPIEEFNALVAGGWLSPITSLDGKQQDFTPQIAPDPYELPPVSHSSLIKLDRNIKKILKLTDYRNFRLSCFASVTFQPGNITQNPAPPALSPSLAIGNTDTEALSTYLANTYGRAAKASPDTTAAQTEEEMLEGMQFTSVLENVFLDKPARFAMLRHEKGFQAEYGGLLWTLRKAGGGAAKARQADEQADLPPDVAAWLAQVNELQFALDRSGCKIDSERYQLFADWCKYLSVSHSPDASGISPDAVRNFLQAEDFPSITSRETEQAQLLTLLLQRLGQGFDILSVHQQLRMDDIEDWEGFYQALLQRVGDDELLTKILQKEFPKGRPIAIDARERFLGMFNFYYFNYRDIVKKRWPFKNEYAWLPFWWLDTFTDSAEQTKLLQWLKDHAQAVGTAKYSYVCTRLLRVTLELYFPQINPRPVLELQAKAAPRYWRPQDPSLLLAGDKLQPTYRHGLDGRLRSDGLMQVYPTKFATPETLHSQIFQPGSPYLQDKIATSGQVNPWHAILMDWAVEFYAVERGGSYDPHFLFNNYRLKIDAVDFSESANVSPALSPQTYTGSAILTPFTVKKRLREIEQKLVALIEPLISWSFYDYCLSTLSDADYQKSENPVVEPGLGAIFNNLKTFNGLWVKKNLPHFQTDLADPGTERTRAEQIALWLTGNLQQLAHDSAFLQQSFDAVKKGYSNYSGAPSEDFPTALSPDNASTLLDFTQAQSRLWQNDTLLYPNKNNLSPQEWISIPGNKDQLIKNFIDNDYPVESYWQYVHKKASRGSREKWNNTKATEPKDKKAKQDFLKKNLNAFIFWYEGRVKAYSQILVLLHYHTTIKEYGVTPGQAMPTKGILSQSLSGFTDALLMRHEGIQMPIEEPFPFPGYNLAQQVRTQVLGANHTAPRPLNPFHPIRAGRVNLSKVRLISTFGQHADVSIDTKRLYFAAGLAGKWNEPKFQFHLPPRLAQAGRLNFRWLAGRELPGQHRDEVEVIDHPASSPICGWLLPNYLDNSLMVYGPAGDPLGFIDHQGRWRSYPGNANTVLPGDLPNRHLARLVQWVVKTAQAHPPQNGNTGFFQQLLSVLQSAIENIDPENFAQHEALSLLMGRPLAVVRAMVQVELMGNPALHQGWDQFRQSLTQAGRDSLNFEQVNIPVRIGEHSQLNDGVVGYLLEAANGFKNDRFYSPQADLSKSSSTEHPGLRTRSDKGDADFDFPLPMYDAAGKPVVQKLTLLMDPRGKAHATTGILPVKAIDIPPTQFSNALRTIEIAFQSSPILSPHNRLHISLPTEAGYHWSWAEQTSAGWREIAHQPLLRQSDLQAAFPRKAALLWQDLVNAKWIKEQEAGVAEILPADQRVALSDVDHALAGAELEPKVIELFESLHLSPFRYHGGFHGQQALRDGWLKLRANNYQAQQKPTELLLPALPDWEQEVGQIAIEPGKMFTEAIKVKVNCKLAEKSYPADTVLRAEPGETAEALTTFTFTNQNRVAVTFAECTTSDQPDATNYQLCVMFPTDSLLHPDLTIGETANKQWKISAANDNANGWSYYYLIHTGGTKLEAGGVLVLPIKRLLVDARKFVKHLSAEFAFKVQAEKSVSVVRECYIFTSQMAVRESLLTFTCSPFNELTLKASLNFQNKSSTTLKLSAANFLIYFEPAPASGSSFTQKEYNQLRQLKMSLHGKAIALDTTYQQNPHWILRGSELGSSSLKPGDFFQLLMDFTDVGLLNSEIEQTQVHVQYAEIKKQGESQTMDGNLTAVFPKPPGDFSYVSEQFGQGEVDVFRFTSNDKVNNYPLGKEGKLKFYLWGEKGKFSAEDLQGLKVYHLLQIESPHNPGITITTAVALSYVAPAGDRKYPYWEIAADADTSANILSPNESHFYLLVKALAYKITHEFGQDRYQGQVPVYGYISYTNSANRELDFFAATKIGSSWPPKNKVIYTP